MKSLDLFIKFMNSTIGGSIDLYKACYVVAFFTIFIFNTIYAKKFGISKFKALILTVSSYLLILGWAYILAWVESLFTDWGHHNAVRVYIWMPVLLFFLSKPMKIDWKKACDFIAPSACIVYGIARLGCLFPGCCRGIPFSWGIYNAQAETIVFPVQFFEAVTSMAIAFYALSMNKNKKYEPDSKTYFKMLIPYGIGRFIWEFFADNEKIFFNISSLALHALVMSVVGIVMLLILRKSKKEDNVRIS